jgi:hypothetical protein
MMFYALYWTSQEKQKLCARGPQIKREIKMKNYTIMYVQSTEGVGLHRCQKSLKDLERAA